MILRERNALNCKRRWAITHYIKNTLRHMNESKEFQTQRKEIDLLNYCKGKTFPKDWTYIHEILRLNKLPRRDLAAPYLCLSAAAWDLTSTQDKKLNNFTDKFHTAAEMVKHMP